ncbi:MAG TPA: VCBS repeat-containing protein, partial [Gaiellaceae bacterium]
MIAPALLLAAARAVAGSSEPAFDPIVFELVETSGIAFVTNSGRTAHRHQPETMVAGAAIFDFDNDGRLDVFLTNGAALPALDKSDPVYWNRLYRNLGSFRFEDVTEKAGVKGHGYDNGVATGDFDNDGFADLFVAGLRENVLYRNRGDGTFEDVTAKAGLKHPDPDYGTLWAVAAAFLDFDKDGDLDLFVSNYVIWDP